MRQSIAFAALLLLITGLPACSKIGDHSSAAESVAEQALELAEESIATPGDRFPHHIDDLGGVRLIL